MAQRGRKEFRGRDYQRVLSLKRSIDMVFNMDVDRMYWNALSRKDYQAFRQIFISDPEVSYAVALLQQRIDEVFSMVRGVVA